MLHRFSPTMSCRYETLGSVLANTGGTLCTAGTSNAKGSWVALGTTSFPYQSVILHAAIPSGSADFCVDLGIDDGAGNTFVAVPDVRVNAQGTVGPTTCPFPLHVPGSTALKARVGSSTNSATIRVWVTGASNGWAGAAGFGRVVSLYTPASSRGVTVDPGATANTKGAWVVLTTGVTQRLGGFVLQLGGAGSTSTSSNPQWLLDVAIGATGSEQVILDSQNVRALATHEVIPHTLGPHWLDLAGSTQIQVRASSSSATAAERTLDVAAHGFVS